MSNKLSQSFSSFQENAHKSSSFSQSRQTVFTDPQISILVPAKYSPKKSAQAIQRNTTSTSQSKRQRGENVDIFNEGGKRKYKASQSIDAPPSNVGYMSIPRKAKGFYNQERMRESIKRSQSGQIQGSKQVVTQSAAKKAENKIIARVPAVNKIKTYYDNPKIIKSSINNDFQIALPTQSTKQERKPPYYLYSKNMKRIMNDSNTRLLDELNSSRQLLNNPHSSIQLSSKNNQSGSSMEDKLRKPLIKFFNCNMNSSHSTKVIPHSRTQDLNSSLLEVRQSGQAMTSRNHQSQLSLNKYGNYQIKEFKDSSLSRYNETSMAKINEVPIKSARQQTNEQKFNNASPLPYRHIHVNKVAIGKNGASFYLD